MPRMPRLVVMGVSGSGKSTVGELLARTLQVPFVDADDLHPEANKLKMASGTPLTDDDRWPWLALVGAELSEGGVVACSALKRSYRDAIRAAAPDAQFIYLEVAPAILAERMKHRVGHFMPVSLLDSQLATLEPLESDEAGITIASDLTPEQIVAKVTP